MKREAVNYFYVGLFVLGGAALLLYILFRIGNGSAETEPYYTLYRNVSGLSSGTTVTYEGYPMGYIGGIEPQRSEQGIRYRIELRLDSGWKIPADSVAHIHAEGLLSNTVINISDGISVDFLQPGDLLKGEQAVSLFAALGDMAAGFGDLNENGIRPLLTSLNKTARELDGELGTRLPVILDNVQELIAKVDVSATYLGSILNAETAQASQRIIGNVDHASADFRSLTTSLIEVKTATSDLVARLDGMVSDVEPDLQETISELRRVIERASRYSDGILHNLDSTSRNMNEFSRQIRENPGRLIGGAVPRDPVVAK
ncbi:MAG: MlaD family protein [Thiogranum sp.]|nr:MlaD family protein [Thiogranum sp.]